MRHSTISIGRDTVTKTSAPHLMRVEVEKTRRAFEIGRSCGLFRAPEVLDYNSVNGVAVFERLAVQPISKALAWGGERAAFAGSLGTALAVIHRELKLPDDMRVPLPPEFALSREEVFLHGDLSVDNVCVGSGQPPIAILDWQMTPKYGGQATYGTRYWDLLWHVGNLIKRPLTRFLFCNPVAPVARALLDGYFRESKQGCDVNILLKYAIRFFDLDMRQARQETLEKSWGRARLLLPRSRAILDEFIESLSTI